MTETITMTVEELEQIINENIELGIQQGVQQGINITNYERDEKDYQRLREANRNLCVDLGSGRLYNKLGQILTEPYSLIKR